MIKNLHRIFIFFGVVCVLFSLSLTAYNLYLEVQAKRDSECIVDEILDRMPQKEQLPEEAPFEATIQDVPFYRYEPNYEMPTIVIDGVKYIGTLSISELGLELPIASEWDYSQLKKTPCRYSGSAYSNDMVICAHNYSTHFAGISGLSEKSVIVFTDADGNVFRYEVYDVEVLKPNQTEEMNSYSDGITLFTCTLSGKTRVTVRTVLIED